MNVCVCVLWGGGEGGVSCVCVCEYVHPSTILSMLFQI